MKQIPKLFAAALLLISVIFVPVRLARAQTAINDDEIRNILKDRIDRAKKSVGIVVGIIDDKGTRIISYGAPSTDSKETVNGDSVFEIGSVTKVFTAILLEDMVNRGQLALSDPISKFLPASVKAPMRAGKEITLIDLSSQVSGLPSMPDNMKPKDATNPYADYTVEQMYAFLSGAALTRDIGSKYEYSNLGVGLLGHILTLRAGKDYETLVRSRISGPLKMTSTAIKLTPAMQARLVHGHDERLKPVANWDLPTFAGAGALRSTVNDMLRFLAANMGLGKSSLTAVMQKTHQPLHDTGVPNLEIGLGWHILKKFDAEIVWHNGGTGGYHSFIGFDKKKRRGVVILSNSSNSIDDIAYHILESRFALAFKEHKAIKLDPRVFDAYVGGYQLAPGAILTFTRKDDRFFIQLTGKEPVEIFAETGTDFFLTVVDAQLTFVKDDKGKVTRVILHQGGDQPAIKIK